jgi:hypothetical protein
MLPRLDPGSRTLIAGRTGSGKTTLGGWLLSRSPQHWLILNPKHSRGYADMTLPADYYVIKSFHAPTILKALRDYQIVDFRPDNAEATHEFLDSVIGWLYQSVRNVGLCADELYTLHSANGRAGAGLTGWLTRGRERKQSFLGLTQRPAWLSRFVFSEADHIAAMNLRLLDDRRRLVDVTGRAAFNYPLTDRQWLWYIVATDTLRRYGPVPFPLSPNPQESHHGQYPN